MAKDFGTSINSNPELRQIICLAIQNLIEKSLNVIESSESSETQKQLATETIETVSKFSKNFLPILFNVYSSMSRQSSAYLLELIKAFFKITDKEV